jgi:hypothetical protein
MLHRVFKSNAIVIVVTKPRRRDQDAELLEEVTLENIARLQRQTAAASPAALLPHVIVCRNELEVGDSKAASFVRRSFVFVFAAHKKVTIIIYTLLFFSTALHIFTKTRDMQDKVAALNDGLAAEACGVAAAERVLSTVPNIELTPRNDATTLLQVRMNAVFTIGAFATSRKPCSIISLTMQTNNQNKQFQQSLGSLRAVAATSFDEMLRTTPASKASAAACAAFFAPPCMT